MNSKWTHCSHCLHAAGAALPVVAALPHRAAELQAHRSFCCCQAIVRSAEVAQGMDWLYLTPLSLPCVLSLVCLCSLWCFYPSFFLSSLASVFSFLFSPLFSLKHAAFYLFSHSLFGSFIIEQGCFIHSVFMISSWFPLLTNYMPVASKRLGAHYSSDPFVLHCSHCNTSVIK